MIIKNSKFITSYACTESYSKADYPAEFCFAGRSNVGKSTLINMLCGAKIARTSQTPGRTRLINIFDCNEGEFMLVDLPGYGYAKASQGERESWRALAEGYFKAAKTLKRVFVLVDIRVKSPLDKQMLEYLYFFRQPFSIIATKCDKVSKAELQRSIMSLAAYLNVGRDNIIPAAYKGIGKERILGIIKESLDETISIK